MRDLAVPQVNRDCVVHDWGVFERRVDSDFEGVYSDLGVVISIDGENVIRTVVGKCEVRWEGRALFNDLVDSRGLIATRGWA